MSAAPAFHLLAKPTGVGELLAAGRAPAEIMSPYADQSGEGQSG